ncbi:MBL fold metallo-hydrolase [Embleya sp. AB8]|uniref:MBL fold metallo-hydrolase n=1 Tax=Embleya sp. AB8 TaxID=3156304 RepID=UPI003C714EC5
MSEWRLRDDVALHVDYVDTTEFGSPVGSRPEATAREAFAPVLRYVERHGFADLVRRGPELLRRAVAEPAFRRITRSGHSLDGRSGDGRPLTAGRPLTSGRSFDAGWELHADLLFPDPAQARPSGLTFRDGAQDRVRRIDCADDDTWPWVHALIAELSGPSGDPEMTRDPRAKALLETLRDDGLLCPRETDPAAERPSPGLEFVGHNTVVVRSREAAVVVDPLFFAYDTAHPADYQPLRPADLGPLDAVLITHSHPDHFAPASLLRLPPSTRIVVPRVERETVLTVDLARRVRELGFEDVVELDWWEQLRIGDIDVHALPFHGEQPTDGPVLHPDVRNHGNTYLVRTPTGSAAFLADSGRDARGEVREVAARARARLGPVDVVFCGYRGWLMYPVQLLFTSVARYLALVPPEQWNCRQRLMTTPDEAVDIAERWGARLLVPYADGGAPWYWRAGLGPRADEQPGESTGFDPYPERVATAARNRTEMPDGLLGSAVEVLLLRPGDAIHDVAGGRGPVSTPTPVPVPVPIRRPGHRWPYAERMPIAAGASPLSRD